jgi:putative chitinase
MENLNELFIGIVEDNKDPNRKGRIKVRIPTLYNNIPLEDIPYASPAYPSDGRSFNVPAIGKIVNVLFLTRDLYDPYYIYSENLNQNLQKKLSSLTDDEYKRFIALTFDDRTQIFADNNELTLDHYFNKMTITKWGINLELKDKKQYLTLGSRDADQDAVLGTRFFEWMDKFIDELSSPFSLIGNMGAPVLKPKLKKLCDEYKSLRPDFVSKHVKVVDNDEVDTLQRDTTPDQNDNIIIPSELQSQELINNINSQNRDACSEISSTLPKGPGSVPDPEDIPEPSSNQAVFKVVRYKFMGDRTIGKLYINDKYYCDTLEDVVRNLSKERKIFGETAIPYGVYKLTVGPTSLPKNTAPTGRLPLVNDVPYFEGIRIHRWGKPQDTNGCLLVGNLDKTRNVLINYGPIADKILETCEKYQKKGIRMTIAYTKGTEEDTGGSGAKTSKSTYNDTEYIQKDNSDTAVTSESSCVVNKPDSSWIQKEFQDYKINGEEPKYEGNLLLTENQLRYIIPNASNKNIQKFLMPINITLKKFNINTPLKISAFLSQIAAESGDLKYTKELGSDNYFLKYEPNTSIGKDLGNTKKGDGLKYKGRGILQVTGRSNYQKQTDTLGQDFINNPDLLEHPLWACVSAGVWWFNAGSKMEKAIERKDIRKISTLVNGKNPANGINHRIETWNRALKLFNIT